MNGSNSQTDFYSLMLGEGVKPIETQPKVSTRERLRRGDLETLNERRRRAEGDAERCRLSLDQLINPLDPIVWKRDGVQEGVYRNLRLGKYSIDARLDLINRSLAEASSELPGFVKECVKAGLRTVMITHGRGKHIESPHNLMKSALCMWLPTLDDVLAFHSAQPQHGGLASLYLLLRKNEEQKLANKERHH